MQAKNRTHVRTNDVWIRHLLEFIAMLKQIGTCHRQQMNIKMTLLVGIGH